MKHLGDITKINGAEADRVCAIIGGSPCQDMSIAGTRDGLNGTRSCLFTEQIRVITEMRRKDKDSGKSGADVFPRYMLWENVPGAFSSNGGEDFRTVLEQTARIADENAVVPRPSRGRWTNSGCIMGDGWSIAWRVLDAQFWGVPQRRRRIALVADFGGESAPEILFERKSLSGDFTQSRSEREGTPRVAFKSTEGADGETRNRVFVMDHACDVIRTYDNTCPTLTSRMGTGGNQIPLTLERRKEDAADSERSTATGDTKRSAGFIDGNGTNSRGIGYEEERSPTLRSGDTPSVVYCVESVTSDTDSNHIPRIPKHKVYAISNGQPNQIGLSKNTGALNCMHDQQAIIEAYGIGRDAFNCGKNAKYTMSISKDIQPTITAKGAAAVCHKYTVRRLTPLECEKLQGFPDGWTDIGEWTDGKGKIHKSSDTVRYKALGNSIALPPWRWVIGRMSTYCTEPTMASLFDGIGGFPLIWEEINGKGTCLWSSEIEEFPIAVTKLRFGKE